MSCTVWSRVVVGALIASLAACGGSSPKRLSYFHAQAVEREDWEHALSYLDAELGAWVGHGAGPTWSYDAAGNATLNEEDIFEQGRNVKRGQRVDAFIGLVEAELAKLGPLTDANAEAVFRRLVALRMEARRPEWPGETGVSPRQEDLAIADRRALAPRLIDAAALWWKQVDAAVEKGDLVQAVVLGATMLDHLPASSPHRAPHHALMQRAAAIHLEHANAASDATQYGAKALHTALAIVFGAQVQPFTSAALIADTTLSWTVEIKGACTDVPLAEHLAAVFKPSTGPAATMIVELARCERITEDLPPSKQDVPYTVKVKKRVAKLSWQSKCSQVSSLPDAITTGAGSNRKTDYIRNTSIVCSTPVKDFHGETEEIEVDETRYETVTVQNRRMRSIVKGSIVIRVDGKDYRSPLEIDAASEVDSQFRAERGTSKTFDTEELAEVALAPVIDAPFDAAVAAAQEHRAREWVAKAQGAAALDADHALYIAARLVKRASPELVAAMATRYRVTEDVVHATIAGEPLPRLDLSRDPITLPEVPQFLLESDQAGAKDQAFSAQGLRAQLLLMFPLVGVSSTSEAMVGTQRGVVAATSLGVVFPGKVAASTLGFRLGGGIDQTGTGFVDFDFLLGYGVRYRGLSVIPLAGVGMGATPGYDSEEPDAEAFEVPAAVFAELGLQVRYAFASAPITLEGTYTKAFRSSSAMPRERRTELRLLSYVPFRFGLMFRYAEYLRESDDFVTLLGADGRAAQTYWILAGKVF